MDETIAPPSQPLPPNTSPVNIEDEMRKSYLDYSMSVIIGRALPDVRDGLKPVHRRILFGMHELGNTSSRPFKKCARIVGDVMGKYHPHGDAAIYDALVRLAQDWNMRAPVVQPQGNFGSIDGDPAAAQRYTEARLARLGEETLADIDKDTVDFGPNYDGQEQEPLVLPTRFPNLLVNGSAGIAVGMATNIPPHNMSESIDATIHLIDHPTATVHDLIKHIPGPDFPTGGFIHGRDGIMRAYTTGRGHLKVRAKAEIITNAKSDRESIIVDEIPYQVNKAKLIEQIADLVREKRLEGISDIRDESDRQGMRIVIEIKRDAMANVVLNNLFALTAMQTTFGVIMLAIDHGQPRTLNLKEILERFISHRREVVTRRSRYELKKAEARRHIVEGLLVAQDLIDHVITIIRRSVDGDQAKWALMHALSPSLYQHERFKDLPKLDPEKAQAQMAALVERAKKDEASFDQLTRTYVGTGFSEEQAKAILDMRLQRLTGLEREELMKEMLELFRQIAWLRKVLSEESTLLGVIKDELRAIKTAYGDARRTQIVAETDDLQAEDLIADEEMVVTLSHAGYIKRNAVTEYRAQRRGGRGKTGAGTREDDFVSDLFVASTHAYVLAFTNKGRLYWLKVHEIPLAGRSAKGKPIINLISFQEGEQLAAIQPVREFVEGRFVMMVTKKGVIKKTDLMAFANPRPSGIIALGIDDGDALVSVNLTDGSQHILISTRDGMSIRFEESEVRAMGRSAYGVKGITLEGNDEVVSAEVVETNKTILTATEKGYGKRTEESEYRVQGRGGKGIIDIKTTERNGPVVGVAQVSDSDEIMIITNQGMLIRTPVKGISVIGRNTQGVRLITLENEAEKVVGIAKIAESTEVDEGDSGPNGSNTSGSNGSNGAVNGVHKDGVKDS
jgi:DNA gyrase subunit A